MPKAKRKKSKKDNKHYVSNKDFLDAIIEHKKLIEKSELMGLPKPQISEYIGESLIKIANGISNLHNFINYPFKEEMICDGIENSLKYFNNFNPEKSKNPFTYFSTIIYWAMVRRIQKEHTILYTKYKMVDNLLMTGAYEDNEKLISPQKYISDFSDEQKQVFMENFEKVKEKKSKKQKNKLKQVKNSLIKFI